MNWYELALNKGFWCENAGLLSWNETLAVLCFDVLKVMWSAVYQVTEVISMYDPWDASSCCRWQRLQMSLCDLQNVSHRFKLSGEAYFHLISLPLQKAMHSQPPASDEVKHIHSTAHYSFYYHKCHQSSSSPLLLLQWWKCQMHLQQSEHSDVLRAQQPITVLTLPFFLFHFVNQYKYNIYAACLGYPPRM